MPFYCAKANKSSPHVWVLKESIMQMTVIALTNRWSLHATRCTHLTIGSITIDPNLIMHLSPYMGGGGGQMGPRAIKRGSEHDTKYKIVSSVTKREKICEG